MDDKTRVNNSVFNDETNPLFTREQAADVIRFHTFSAAQTNTPIWLPPAGRSICLTALQISALTAVTVTLNRAANAPFLSIVLTTAVATFSESFPAPLLFAPNEAISLTTNAAGTIYITLMGYAL